LAANSDSSDPIGDFVQLVEGLSDVSDYLIIDISCPNTQNGQQFLSPRPLAELLSALRAAAVRLVGERGLSAPRPQLIKLSPDIAPDALAPLLRVATDAAIDGIVVANTSTARPADLKSRHKTQRGGLSGPPLAGPASELLKLVYRETGGTVPLIAVGGIASGKSAYARIRAGASLIQLYTGLVYAGPSLLQRMKTDLADCLERDGFSNLTEAIGADYR
jgi:dihydroorotate dehydrogenase